MINKIKEVANQTRRWAERYAANNYFPRDLTGVCAIAATKLFLDLQKNGFKDIHIVENTEHAFVVCEGHIVDVTATQFGLGSIVIEPKSKKPNYTFWKTDRKFKTANGFMKYQNRVWSDPRQHATQNRVSKIYAI